MSLSVGNLGSALAQYNLRQILVSLNMPVVNKPEVMIGNAGQVFNEDGKLNDDKNVHLFKKLLTE